MEKSERGPLQFFGALAVIVIILPMLFIGNCAYKHNRMVRKGKAWCESVISEYEADREKFLKVHSNRLDSGLLILHPSPEHKVVRARFIVTRDGEYVCNYSGKIRRYGHEYTSKTREWRYLD